MVSNHVALILDYDLGQQLVWMLHKGLLAGTARHVIHLQVGILGV